MGDGVIENKEEAIKWFTISSEQGNEYAQFFLDNMDRFQNPSVSLTVSRMLHHMSRIFEDNVPLKSSGVGIKIDSKLMRKLREKKMAQGHKKMSRSRILSCRIQREVIYGLLYIHLQMNRNEGQIQLILWISWKDKERSYCVLEEKKTC